MKYIRQSFQFFLGPVLRRKNYLIFQFLNALSNILSCFPRRLGFSVIVIATAMGLPGKSLLTKAFQPLVVRTLQKNPRYRFSNGVTKLLSRAGVRSLVHVGAYQEAAEVVTARGMHIIYPEIATLLALALFELGEFSEARAVVDTVFSPSYLAEEPHKARFKGLLDVIAHDLSAASRNLASAGRAEPHLMQPHQNMAARYSSSYVANALDIKAGDLGRLYDSANFVAQRVTHVGRGDLGADIYSVALDAQRNLAEAEPLLSPVLTEFLEEIGIAYDDLKILPDEWFSQIGHLGMLDILFRMRELGWWDGKAVMLPRSDLVANGAFLRLFQPKGELVVKGSGLDAKATAELRSLQRWKGMSFNAFELPGGQIVPWQDAGALLMRQWEKEGRGFPLREQYDRQFGSSQMLDASVAKIKALWGMGPDDWYVCLHMRDAAHYGELPGMGQTHRNAAVENYIAAIKHITDQGGWVIKLGGRHSSKIPKMPRVFDYARSKYCSDVMDLHLIRNARFFIGTTSGLTNVAVSFGVPCALVNCITTDAQLWSNRVRFALKRLRLLDGTLINQHDMTSTPWRWRVFQAELLGRAGAVVEENTSAEILETVKEVEALALGQSPSYVGAFANYDETITRWRESLAFPHFYGDALPGFAALTTHETFLQP